MELQKGIVLIFQLRIIRNAQCGARTHDPGIKSPMLYRLSQPGLFNGLKLGWLSLKDLYPL